MKKCALLILFASLMFNPTINSYSSDWPNWRGPKLDGISSETDWNTDWLKKDPEILWTAKVGIGYSSMAVADGKVITLGNKSNKDTIFCLDAKTGKEIWKHVYDAPIIAKFYKGGPGGTPAIDNGKVYSLSKVGHLWCLDLKTGDVIWSKNMEKDFGSKHGTWGLANSPIIQGDELIIDVGFTISLNKNTGKKNWQSKTYTTAYSTPAPVTWDGKKMYLCFPEPGLVLIDATNGKEIAKLKWKTKYGVNDVTPLIVGKKIYIITGYGRGEGMAEYKDGKLVLLKENKVENHTAQMSHSVYRDGYLFGFEGSKLRCQEFDTFKTIWESKDFGQGSCVLAGDHLLVLSDRGELAVVEASTKAFKEISRKQIVGDKNGWIVPVLSNGYAYCRNRRGDLACVDLTK